MTVGIIVLSITNLLNGLILVYNTKSVCVVNVCVCVCDFVYIRIRERINDSVGDE